VLKIRIELYLCIPHVLSWRVKVKVKVKVTLEQATKVQRGIRGIAVLFL
jgi:hypothetical protein